MESSPLLDWNHHDNALLQYNWKHTSTTNIIQLLIPWCISNVWTQIHSIPILLQVRAFLTLHIIVMVPQEEEGSSFGSASDLIIHFGLSTKVTAAHERKFWMLSSSKIRKSTDVSRCFRYCSFRQERRTATLTKNSFQVVLANDFTISSFPQLHSTYLFSEQSIIWTYQSLFKVVVESILARRRLVLQWKVG